MKYKVGDKVKIKSLDWYNDNKDDDEIVVCQDTYFNEGRTKFCDKIVTIKSLHGSPNCKLFRIVEDNGYYWWSTDMIEGLVEEEIAITTSEPLFKTANVPLEKEMEWSLPAGYQFKDENGNVINATKIVLEKKTYPKTREECYRVLNYCFSPTTTKTIHKEDLIRKFQFLLLYRDAYWKIAGDEMGLGKSWKPDWESETEIKYTIVVDTNKVCEGQTIQINTILAFPTEEMRDAFYENFKELIGQYKELL